MEKRRIKFVLGDPCYHILQCVHGNTYQIIATEDKEMFTPLIGVFLIKEGDNYHRVIKKEVKDKFGRKQIQASVVMIDFVSDEEWKPKSKIITDGADIRPLKPEN